MKSLFLKIAGSIFMTAIATLLVASAPASARGIDVYLSKPKVGLSPYSDITTETFNSLTAGTTYTSNYTSSIGTYVLGNGAKMKINANDIYGAGTGNYMAFGAQSSSSMPITLNFNSPQSYFGFTWCAGDANNGLTFYNGSQLIGHYSTASILSVLSQTTVKAIDGSNYNSVDYFGQPQTGQNNREPYAFVNFISTAGMFDRVVFDNSNTTGTGFESDNHTIRALATTPDRSFVSVGSAVPSVPESGSLILLGLGGATSLLALVRRSVSRSK